MHLLDLPADLLVTLPFYLNSIDDLYSLLRTSRALYGICNNTKAALSPRLRPGKRPSRPYTHALIASTARQVADFAVQSVANRNALHSSLMRGLEGLLELCVNVAAMTLEDTRQMHHMQHATLPAVVSLIHKDLYGDREDAQQVDLAVLNHGIYCELFHHSITAEFRPVTVPAPLTDGIRQDYLRYCVTDTNCRNVDFSSEFPGAHPVRDSGLAHQQMELMTLIQDAAYCLPAISDMTGGGLRKWYEQPVFDPSIVHLHTSEILAQKGLLTMRLVALRANKEPNARGDGTVDGSASAEDIWDDDAEVEVAALKADVRRAHDAKTVEAVEFAKQVSRWACHVPLLDRDIWDCSW